MVLILTYFLLAALTLIAYFWLSDCRMSDFDSPMKIGLILGGLLWPSIWISWIIILVGHHMAKIREQ